MAKIKEPYVKVTEQVKEYPNLLNIDGTSTIGGVVVSPKGKDIQYISGPKDFLEKLVGADELPRDSHISLINAFYCSYFSGLVIARSMDKSGSVTYIHSLDESEEQTWKVLPIYDGQIINTKLSINWNLGFTETDKWAVELNGSVFYHGLTESEFNSVVTILYKVNGPRYEVTSLSDIANIISSWTGMSAAVESNKIAVRLNAPSDLDESQLTQLIQLNPKYFLRTVDGDSIEDLTEITVSVTESPVNLENYLGIKVKDSSLYDYRFEFIGSGDSQTLNIYKESSINSLIGSFQVSLDPNGVDVSGNNNFIENLNTQFEDIEFTVVNELSISDSLELGIAEMSASDKLLYGIDLTKSAEPKYLSSAIYKLGSQTQYPIDYLSPFGITNNAFLKDYIYVGKNNYWLAPVDIPFNYTNSASIKMFGDGLTGGNSDQVIVAGPFDKNTSFLNFPCKIAWSSLYYERVFLNKANNQEFAPVFEQTNGVLSYRNPMLVLSDPDRESLLNSNNGPINFVEYDKANNLYYMNDNRCHTTTDNILSEECTRRLMNKINRDVRSLMKRFKGRVNDNVTRGEVVSLLKLYFDQNIMNQTYKPDAINIICDNSNNTFDIIASHHLAVTIQSRLYGSIKFIDILSEVYPIGVDFA